MATKKKPTKKKVAKKKVVKKSVKKKVIKRRKRMKPLCTQEAEPRAKGRPQEFTPELGIEICKRIMLGDSLRKLCREGEDMPAVGTVFRWLSKGDPTDAPAEFKDFREQYSCATAIRREFKFDGLEEDLHDMTLQPVIINGVPLTVVEDGEPVMVRAANNVTVSYAKLMLDAFKWQASKENPKKYGEKIVNKLVGADDGPIQTQAVPLDFSDMSKADRAVLRKLLSKDTQ